MKSKKGQRVPARPIAPSKIRVEIRQIVLLDQVPLRRAAASECQQAMARLDTAKAEWRRFEREDKTAFERWSAATFGALLSKMREVDAARREKEMLFQEVEMEMFFGGASTPRSAYRRVMKRRNAPPPSPENAQDDPWFEGFEPPPPGSGAAAADSPLDAFDALDEFDQEYLFEDFLRNVAGMNPDRMSDAQYFRMFEEFRESFRNAAGASSTPPPPEQARPPEPAATPSSPAARVKELYRVLVRRLHPDLRAEGNAEVSAIWHDVQEAYAQENIERLEMLLALTDIQSNETGDHTSLFQMRSVLAELRRSFKALQKNLRAAKKEPAWNFGPLAAEERLKLERRMRFEYQATLRAQEGELREMEAMIAGWADRPKPKPGTAKRPRKKGIHVMP